MRRLARHWIGMVLLLQAGVPVVRAGQADLPLPAGVSALPAPTRVDLGSSTLNVYSVMAPMGEEALIAFYRDALARAGWSLGLLPWQASHHEATKRLEKAVTYHRDTLTDAQNTQAQQMLEEFKQTRQRMQRQLFASRGQEHLIVNLWPMGSAGTAVFLNRWSGDRQALAGGSVVDGEPSRGTWPLTNTCCSGEEIPNLSASLPDGFPVYPGATAIARSTPPRGSRTTLLFTIPETVTKVNEFYDTQMRTQGWTRLTEKPSEALAHGSAARPQTYERNGTRAVLTILGIEEASPQTMVMVSAGPRPVGGQGASP